MCMPWNGHRENESYLESAGRSQMVSRILTALPLRLPSILLQKGKAALDIAALWLYKYCWFLLLVLLLLLLFILLLLIFFHGVVTQSGLPFTRHVQHAANRAVFVTEANKARKRSQFSSNLLPPNIVMA